MSQQDQTFTIPDGVKDITYEQIPVTGSPSFKSLFEAFYHQNEADKSYSDMQLSAESVPAQGFAKMS